MADDGRQAIQNGLGPRRRIATVDEALAFTPLSSLIPFNPGVVPSPVTWNSTAPLRLLSNEQAASANKILSSLDKEASRAETASGRLQRTLGDVRKLLNTKGISQ